MQFSFEAMGTLLEIKIYDPISNILQEKIKSEILDFTYYFDETYSRFKENSLVTQLSQKTGIFAVPRDFVEMLQIYEKINQLTSGSVNPLIGNTLADYGYDEKYSLKKKDFIRPTPNFSETISILGPEKISISEKCLIDIGALGKGYWVDKVRIILNKNKIGQYMINGSGDIYYKNSSTTPEKMRVALEDESGNIFGYTEIINQSLCGSGISKRNWSINEEDNLHHVIDAKTNAPTKNIFSVWVKTTSSHLPTTYADIVATALFFAEPKKLQQALESENIFFEYYIIYSEENSTNKKTLVSKNFNAKFIDLP